MTPQVGQRWKYQDKTYRFVVEIQSIDAMFVGTTRYIGTIIVQSDHPDNFAVGCRYKADIDNMKNAGVDYGPYRFSWEFLAGQEKPA